MLAGFSVALVFSLISAKIHFDGYKKVDLNVPAPYLDEIFHIPQTQRYCAAVLKAGQSAILSVPWDPKITTPPGLYILGQTFSQNLYQPILRHFGSEVNDCEVSTLRYVNTLGTALVLPLVLYGIQRRNRDNIANTVMAVSIFPLFYFFGKLFYTDVWSTLFVLLSLWVGLVSPASTSTASKILGRTVSAVLVAFSCTFRQTNILWAGYVAVTLLEEEHRARIAKEKSSNAESVYAIPDFFKFLYTTLTTPSLTIPYAFVAFSFTAFLFINQGIALGDKDNHEFGLNIAQIFHFALHALFFSGVPSLLASCATSHGRMTSRVSLKSYFEYCTKSHPLIAGFSMLAIGLGAHYFTGDPHPFTLADNRHFTFYIWRRLIQPTKDSVAFALLIAAPLYHTGLWLLWPREKEQKGYTNIYTRIFYVVAVFATIVPSPLLEPRYYIVPYVIWRARHYTPVTTKIVPIVEFLWYSLINYGVLYLFLNKPFTWPSEPNALQRFMW